MDGMAALKKSLTSIYERRRKSVYALSLYYAAQSLQYFRLQQSNNAYWENQTGFARDLMFSNAYIEDNVVAWFMAHAVHYGVYLELANDRKHEAIRPIVQRFAGRFHKDDSHGR